MTKILVVDDHPANRELITTLLRYHDHCTFEAADGEQGLAIATQELPGLIISDILMPSMDGFEFVRRLRAHPSLRDVAVIFSSAHYLGREAAELAKACGVEVLLPKPIEPERFLETIERILSGRAPEAVRPVHTPPPAFADAHRRLMTNQLAATADALQASNRKLGELVQVGLRLGAAASPLELLEEASQSVRRLAGARLGMAMVAAADPTEVGLRAVAGVPKEKAPPARARIRSGSLFEEIIEKGQVTRVEAGGHLVQDLGLPANIPGIANFLGAPLGTAARTSGVIGVANKIGPSFTVEDENIVRAVGAQAGRAFENMTLIRELEERTRELNRVSEARTRLLVCAGHDLRQPLQALRLFIGMLEGQAKDAQMAAIAANASKALGSAEKMTDALMEVARFDSGSVRVQSETFSLAAIFDSLGAECGPMAAEKGLSLRIEPTEVVLRSDPLLIHRALRNLVWNAICYTDAGRVMIRCRRRGSSQVAIQVWDTGRGIPADRREAIFEDFYRIPPSEDHAPTQGLGLGLAIVARKARLLNARVAVHSRPGRGSVFSFILPIENDARTMA